MAKFINIEFGPNKPLSPEDKARLDQDLAENLAEDPSAQIGLNFFDLCMSELDRIYPTT